DGYDDGFDEAEEHAVSFRETIERLKEIGTNPEVEQLNVYLDDFEAYYDVGIKMAHEYIDNGPESGNKLMGTFDTYSEDLNEEIDAFVSANIDKLNSEVLRVNSKMNTNINMTIVLLAIGLLLAGIASFVIPR